MGRRRGDRAGRRGRWPHRHRSPTTLLLPQVVDAVDIPVIAAGGFFDGRGLVAALAYGAAGVAMGTRFLLTQESTVPDAVKRSTSTRRSPTRSSRRASTAFPHRVLRTELVDHLEHGGARHGAATRAAQRARVQEAVGHVVARHGRAKASR